MVADVLNQSEPSEALEPMSATASEPSATQGRRVPLWALQLLVVACLSSSILWYYLGGLLGFTAQAQSVDIAAIILGVCGVIAAAIVPISLPQPHAARLRLAAGVFLGWALVSTVASGRGWTPFVGETENGLGWFTLLAVFVVAAAAARNTSAISRLLVSYAPWIVAGESILLGSQLAAGAQMAGTLPNSTYLGEFLLLLLPWTLAGWSGRVRDRTAWRLLAVALGVAALAVSGSRVALAVALVWVVWALVRPLRLSRTMRALLSAAALFAAAGLAFLFARAEVLGSVGISTLGLRPELWLTSLRATLARPIVGWGPDGLLAGGSASTTVEMARAGTALVLQPGGPDPHSFVAWVAVSMGFVGLALLGWLGYEIARQCARGRSVRPFGLTGAWAFGMTATVMLTAPVAVQVLPLLGLVVGVSVGYDTLSSEHQVRARARFRSVLLAGTFALCFLLMIANGATRAPLEVAGVGRSPRLARTASLASRLWRFDAHLASLAGQHWAYAGGYSSRTYPQQLRAEMARAARLDRRNPYLALDEAISLRFWGSPPAQVDRAYSEAYRRFPFHPIARADRALFLAGEGRLAEARRELDIARLGDVSQAPQLAVAIQAAEEALAKAQQ
jgi:hypothetical protein